ncbi:uncharacterized protein TRAVEDRAFT_127397 [Trametes versicolor FP-101664 SS1]|uniref:uncharacterized protein n=1 Tax=Trametes versicolor (strain FP-101664) TaxID=717944 RepID=UPI0004623073|nr:uncharacterized protein TRAVEDRAFT_127397 [Trametes versicolor FP-101664 SS1]EIW56473.1 hypothetical protein TRAVEDRAFT_127397 [Trametes versicolor FP-101664 SS1]
MPRRLPSSHRYIRFAVSPPCTDALTLRKTIQDALGQSFGLVSSHTYVDLLWLADDGTAVVVRIGETDAPKLLAAVTASNATPRLSVVKESSFLPALLCAEALA